MEGRVIVSVEQRRPNLRFPFPQGFAERLSGVRIDQMTRRAKYLLAHLSSGETLIMHLGMSGRFTIAGEGFDAFTHDVAAKPAHDHVVFHMEGGVAVTYNDPRRFGFMELWPTSDLETCPRLMGMGPEPISNRFSAAYLDEALKGRRGPIKAALLDQSVIAGLGNIYVCEALFRAGISPRRSSATIPGVRAARLAPVVRQVIEEAIEAGGSSISDFAQADGSLGYFQHTFRVYGREGAPCLSCGQDVRRITQSGRSTFYCSACQH